MITYMKYGDRAYHKGLGPKQINDIVNKLIDQNRVILDTNKTILEILSRPSVIVENDNKPAREAASKEKAAKRTNRNGLPLPLSE